MKFVIIHENFIVKHPTKEIAVIEAKNKLQALKIYEKEIYSVGDTFMTLKLRTLFEYFYILL